LTTPEEIRELVRSHLSSEVACEVLQPAGTRIGCLTPLEYPDGDGIVVWVEPHGGHFDVTEYGECLSVALTHPAQDHKALMDQAAQVGRYQGLEFLEGRLISHSDEAGLGEAVWRVALAAAHIAQASAAFTPKRRQHRENEFVVHVTRDFHRRNVPVERERKLEGGSGHTHTATLYVPDGESIFEPIGGAGNLNQVSAVYAKFGDLSRANGYRRFSLIDDRDRKPDEDIENMLTQVSNVVHWTRRDEWLPTLF
jgi:hypothetical protein